MQALLSTHVDENMDKVLTMVEEKTASICDRVEASLAASLGALLARSSQLEEKVDALQ